MGNAQVFGNLQFRIHTGSRKAIRLYYELSGWDKNGKPIREKWVELP